MTAGQESNGQGWETFFFAEQSAEPLHVFRSFFGVWLITYYFRLYDILHLHLGHDGIVTAGEIAEMGRPSVFAWLAGNEAAFHLIFLLAIVSALALAAGWHVRVAAGLAWLTNMSLVNPLIVGMNSGDEIVRIFVFLFFLAALAGHLDCKRLMIPAWSSRLFQVQIALIYFFSGFAKTASADWYRGEALHFVLQRPLWLRVDCSAIDGPLLTGAMTYATLFFELVLFPALVWTRSWQAWVLAGGVLFHVAISLLMKVFVFGELMPIAYLAFLPADSPVFSVIREAARRLRMGIDCYFHPPR